MPHSRSSRLIERALESSLSKPVATLPALLIATAIVAGVGVFRIVFIPATLPYLFYIPTVLGIALMLGKRVGLYATALAAVVAAIGLGGADERFWLTGQQWASTILFTAVTAAMVFVISELRLTFARATRLTDASDEAFAKLAEREGFLSSVLASSPDCIKVLDLDGKLTFMSEGGQKVMEVSDFNAIRGCPWPDFWAGEGNKDAVAAVQAARGGKTRTFIGRAETMAGTPKWWNVAVSPIFARDGKPERILSVSRDITALRANEDERERLVRLVEASTDFIGMSYLDGTAFFLNNAARKLVGLDDRPVGTLNVADFFAPADAARMASEVLPTVDAKGGWTGEIDFRDFRTGEPIPVLCTIYSVAAHGQRIGYATVTRDFRERKRAERQQAVLNAELSHRMKNMMTLVQAMADQTLRSVPEREPVENLGKRLQALASAHVLLLGANWKAARVMSAVTSALETFGQIERVEANGPEVMLGPQAVVSLSLLLHELATNAIKYGALSNDAGRVHLTWEVAERDGEPTFVLRWREMGGPPVVEPSRRGFGSRLIRAGLIGTGGVELRYLPSGLEADLTAPLAHMQEG